MIHFMKSIFLTALVVVPIVTTSKSPTYLKNLDAPGEFSALAIGVMLLIVLVILRYILFLTKNRWSKHLHIAETD